MCEHRRKEIEHEEAPRRNAGVVFEEIETCALLNYNFVFGMTDLIELVQYKANLFINAISCDKMLQNILFNTWRVYDKLSKKTKRKPASIGNML